MRLVSFLAWGGSDPAHEVWVNPDHVIALESWDNGHGDGGTMLYLVSGGSYMLVHSPETVGRRLVLAEDPQALSPLD